MKLLKNDAMRIKTIMHTKRDNISLFALYIYLSKFTSKYCRNKVNIGHDKVFDTQVIKTYYTLGIQTYQTKLSMTRYFMIQARELNYKTLSHIFRRSHSASPLLDRGKELKFKIFRHTTKLFVLSLH